ncbi:MAG: hypothetical protein A3C36_07750 [Omnitrophica WOR_2 bacterium RIFCSPHIGHO2_02_FULL_52_10]|nr:MAG: hypothetical protein A3C36_07750 [Omnitrophica WOR_2 bacterium RIFCSPHIGHO2_02_FULL_52_10]
MAPQHKELAAGRWQELSFSAQMANIGSEVSRALNWQGKNNAELSRKAVVRGIELLDLSLAGARSLSRLRELARLREALVDYFFGANEFASTEALWRNYFDHFAYAVRKDR